MVDYPIGQYGGLSSDMLVPDIQSGTNMEEIIDTYYYSSVRDECHLF